MLRNVAEVGPEGFELGHESQGKTAFSNTGGAQSGALGARDASVDSDLAAWLESCPIDLDGETKTDIQAMVMDRYSAD